MNTNKAYITIAEETDRQYHRKHVILHKNWEWYLAEFDKIRQLKKIAEKMGFGYFLEEVKKSTWGKHMNIYYYSLSHSFEEEQSFWSLKELPAGVKPFTAHSNGCLVTCYYINDGHTIHIYRPNPNASEVYKPLSLNEHIEYIKKNGGF